MKHVDRYGEYVLLIICIDITIYASLTGITHDDDDGNNNNDDDDDGNNNNNDDDDDDDDGITQYSISKNQCIYQYMVSIVNHCNLSTYLSICLLIYFYSSL